MTSLNKYKRKDLGILKEEEGISPQLPRKKRERKYVEKVTINLTKEESDFLNKMFEDSKIPKSTLIREALKKGGLFAFS